MVRGCPTWETPLAQPLPTASYDADFFLDLCLSKLHHHNTVSSRQNDVYTPTFRVYTSLSPLRMGSYFLREAYDLAVGDQRVL